MNFYCKQCGAWAAPGKDEYDECFEAQLMPAVEAIRMGRSGASDPLSPLRERKLITFLKERLNRWHVDLSSSLRYDEAIRAAVIEGLLEWERMAKDDILCRKCAEHLEAGRENHEDHD
jgi:hypothetical protein